MVGRAIVNTIIGGCGGGLSVLFVNKIFFNKKWSYLLTLNGALAGMVAMCAGCDKFEPWSALLVGVFGGAVFTAVREVMIRYNQILKHFGLLDKTLDNKGISLYKQLIITT